MHQMLKSDIDRGVFRERQKKQKQTYLTFFTCKVATWESAQEGGQTRGNISADPEVSGR